MAKIFRKNRQRFLTEKRIKKYLTYAVGEIILVVIGILVALQINSISEDRQRAKLEKILLQQVKFEIQEVYEDVWRDAAKLKMGFNSHYEIIDVIEKDQPYTDSLCFDFYLIKMDEYIFPTNAAYTRLTEEGLDIIQNDTIRMALQALYEGNFPRLTANKSFVPDISEVLDDYYLQAFRPNTDMDLRFSAELVNDTVGTRVYSDEHYVFPIVDDSYGKEYTVGYVPLQFEALKKDPKFHMLLAQTRRYRKIKMLRYDSVKSIIKNVVKIIDRELAKK